MKADPSVAFNSMTSSPSQNPRQGDSSDSNQGIEGNVLQLWNILKRRYRWFFSVFGIVITFVGYETLRDRALNPVYMGSFQILLVDPIDARPSGTGSASTTDPRIRISNVPDLISVLTSPSILHPLAGTAGLNPNALDGRIDVFKPNPRTEGILQVNLRWGNPDEGAKLIKSLAAGYLEFAKEQRELRLARGLQFIDEQMPILQSRVNVLQQKLAEYRRTDGLLEPEERSRQIANKMSETESRLTELQTQYRQLQALKSTVLSGKLISPSTTGSSVQPTSGASASNVPLVATSAFTPLLDSLIAVEKDIAEISGSYKANSPVLQSLIAKRNKIKPALQRRELDSIEASLRENLSAQDALRNQYKDLYDVFRVEGPDLVKKYQLLDQRLNVAKGNLQSYIQERETIRLDMAKQAQPWQLIQLPYFSSDPVEPDVGKRLRTGLLIAVLAGAGASILRDRFDRVFHNISELESSINKPILGSIPYISDESLRASLILDKDISISDSPDAWRVRESMRNLYASIKLMQATREAKLLAISSTVADEGKTSTAVLMASSFSELGLKVLLIDGDMRKTGLHEALHIKNASGLTDLFTNPDLNISSLLQWVSPNLAVITGGYRPPDPAGLLSTERLTAVVAKIRQLSTFDLIIIDTPPALNIADPILISRNLDGLLLLVTLGKTSKTLLKTTMKRLDSAGINTLGVICRDSLESTSQIDYGYYNDQPTSQADRYKSHIKSKIVKTAATKASSLLKWLDRRS